MFKLTDELNNAEKTLTKFQLTNIVFNLDVKNLNKKDCSNIMHLFWIESSLDSAENSKKINSFIKTFIFKINKNIPYV
ncbi:hypothetical protein [Methanobrevibacter filiformis]|uniref:Uncharacterized protein n=1 Tax=Methanobrevibacter filiformis TaxID=55758 RepID=A0A166CK64_9EURY|nr:hypothetical protein [Methanobrevibacter filiformis]KZX14967.1 hypothetical protein MBFIL_07530 [Methanobrevibacter filiformis]